MHQLQLVSPSPSYSMVVFSSLASPGYLSLFSLSFIWILWSANIYYYYYYYLWYFPICSNKWFSIESEWQSISSAPPYPSKYSSGYCTVVSTVSVFLLFSFLLLMFYFLSTLGLFRVLRLGLISLPPLYSTTFSFFFFLSGKIQIFFEIFVFLYSNNWNGKEHIS